LYSTANAVITASLLLAWMLVCLSFVFIVFITFLSSDFLRSHP
jgi:uncharacterized membrane protein